MAGKGVSWWVFGGFSGCGVWVLVPRGGVVGPPVVLALRAAASSSCPLVLLLLLASAPPGPLFPGYGSRSGSRGCIYSFLKCEAVYRRPCAVVEVYTFEGPTAARGSLPGVPSWFSGALPPRIHPTCSHGMMQMQRLRTGL